MWYPLPGPQLDAYLSRADELFYGGAAGGGKSDLLIGLGTTAHRRSIIFRREYPQLQAIKDRAVEIIGEQGHYNDQKNTWRTNEGRILEFGAVQHDANKKRYQGRPHDLKGFDELPNFTSSIYRFLIGWRRTTVAGQRTRVVGAGNPPTDSDGEWVIIRWAPWLDPQHPNPAIPGELRWYAVVDGKDVEREDGTPFQWKGKIIKPTSRTFIPAKLSDNPYLMATDYESTLQSLPEPLRSQLLYGDFAVGVDADPWQVIPTEWVKLAMERGKNRPKPEVPMSALGVDVARGGADKTTLAPRYGNWFDELKKYPGKMTQNGPAVVGVVLLALEGHHHVSVQVDVIGVGTSPYDMLQGMVERVVAVNFGEGSNKHARDRSGKLTFLNIRAEAYWKFREALDPVLGDDIALPDDPELLADLCAPKWGLRSGRIYVESKEELKKRLGRSPDCGDAVIYGHYQDNAAGIMDFYRNMAEEQAKQNGATGNH